MIASAPTRPENLDKPDVRRENGKVFYNPVYTIRTSGMDFMEKLEKYGFETKIIYVRDLVAQPELFGIPSNQNLLICSKK